MSETVFEIATEMLLKADDLEDDSEKSMMEGTKDAWIAKYLRRYAKRLLEANQREHKYDF